MLVSGALLLLLGAGCSSISVQPRSSHAAAPSAPQRLVVAEFGYADESDRVRVDREGPELRAFKHDLRVKMRQYLVKELGRFGIPVEQTVDGKVPPGPPGWLVTGEFTRINQGALINIVGSSAHGVTEDAKRTSKMIADYISQQLARRGAIPPGKAREPKILAGSVDPLGSLKN